MVLDTIEKPSARAQSTKDGALTMKALVYKAVGESSLDDCPKPAIMAPTDAIVRITKTTICGTDLHIPATSADIDLCRHHAAEPQAERGMS